ncbi:hypothetical protein [Thiomicrorhabdus indica]|uniref:hypothetical protein n=1 Tax=Thiomicrorhabdus indica TaxID=2267253 RepID=UPI002AA62E3A|nr:hypothetical protein [Thiomicrorhabdus indica]
MIKIHRFIEPLKSGFIVAFLCLCAQNVTADQQTLIADSSSTSNALVAQYWQKIQANPYHAEAWLDLAITYCSLGKQAEAERIFQLIEKRFAPNANLIAFIQNLRDSQQCSMRSQPLQQVATPAHDKPQIYVNIGLQYTDNINLAADLDELTLYLSPNESLSLPLNRDSQPLSDWQMLLKLDGNYQGNQWYLHHQQPINHSQYNYSKLGGQSQVQLDQDWNTTVFAETSQLSGQAASSLVGIEFQPAGKEQPWSIQTAINYDHQLKENHALNLRYLQRKGNLQWLAYYDFALSDRSWQDQLGAAILYQKKLYQTKTQQIDWQWISQFQKDQGIYSALLANKERWQWQNRLTVNWYFAQKNDWLWHLQYRHMRTQSNIELFEVKKNQIGLFWQMHF